MNDIKDWIAQYGKVSIEHFSELFPYPFLLVEQLKFKRIDQAVTSEVGEDTERIRLKTTNTEQLLKISRKQISQYSEVRIVKKQTEFYPAKITIGRTCVCDLQFEYNVISKFHAFFAKKPDGFYYLIDTKSTNGTWVNEKRLEPNTPVRLRERDTIILGKVVRLKFLFVSASRSKIN